MIENKLPDSESPHSPAASHLDPAQSHDPAQSQQTAQSQELSQSLTPLLTPENFLDNSYSAVNEVKVSFRFLHIYIKDADKIEYCVKPHTRLLEIKQRIDERTKKNFIFFLR